MQNENPTTCAAPRPTYRTDGATRASHRWCFFTCRTYGAMNLLRLRLLLLPTCLAYGATHVSRLRLLPTCLAYGAADCKGDNGNR